jgi:hypothetical protein
LTFATRSSYGMVLFTTSLSLSQLPSLNVSSKQSAYTILQQGWLRCCSQFFDILPHCLRLFDLLPHCFLLRQVGFQHLCPNDSSSLVHWWQHTLSQVPDSFRRGFDSLLLLVSWEVWKKRNRRIFDSTSSTPSQLLQLIHDVGNSWIAAGFRSLAPLFVTAP